MTEKTSDGEPGWVPAVRQMISLTDPVAENASLLVHPDDDMLAFSVASAGSVPLGSMAYFRAGCSIVHTINAVSSWRFGSVDRVGSFLDFAAGYGRSTRFLVEHLPPDRVCVAEIQADALDFQADSFGVETLLSQTDPARLRPPRQFDVVLAASLLTHLPERTFGPWLSALWSCVAPGGVLVFSVHDEAINDIGVDMVDGFGYQRSTEISSLSTDDYGTNFTTEAFVRAQLRQAIGAEAAGAIRMPRALCFLQDVWVVCNGAPPQETLRYDGGPQGCVDDVRVERGQLKLRGWAADRGFATLGASTHRIDEVSIHLDGRVIGRTAPSVERPDVARHLGDGSDRNFHNSGWDIALPAKKVRPTDIVTAMATCEHGAAFALDSGRLDELLARCGAPELFAGGPLGRKLKTARKLARDGGANAVLAQVLRTARR